GRDRGLGAGRLELPDALGDRAQVPDEPLHLLLARLVVRRAQDRRGVDRRDHVRGDVGVDPGSAVSRDAEGGAEERLRGGRTKAYADVRLHEVQLEVETVAAGRE